MVKYPTVQSAAWSADNPGKKKSVKEDKDFYGKGMEYILLCARQCSVGCRYWKDTQWLVNNTSSRDLIM